MHGHNDIVNHLLEQGARVNCEDENKVCSFMVKGHSQKSIYDSVIVSFWCASETMYVGLTFVVFVLKFVP